MAWYRRWIAVLFLAIGVSAAVQVPGQSLSEDTAILVSGPHRGRGVPFLPPNDLVHWAAEYEYRGQTIRLATIDAGAGVGLSGTWEPYPCEPVALQRSQSRAGTVVRSQQALSAGSVVLVALIPDPLIPAETDMCAFVAEFDAAAAFFTEAVGAPGPGNPPVVFPAYLQVGR